MEDTDSLDPSLPWRLGWLGSPLHQRSSPKFGERSRLDWGSVAWDVAAGQRDEEALMEAQTAPCLPEPSHAKATGGRPQVHQLPPLQADKT